MVARSFNYAWRNAKMDNRDWFTQRNSRWFDWMDIADSYRNNGWDWDIVSSEGTDTMIWTLNPKWESEFEPTRKLPLVLLKLKLERRNKMFPDEPWTLGEMDKAETAKAAIQFDPFNGLVLVRVPIQGLPTAIEIYEKKAHAEFKLRQQEEVMHDWVANQKVRGVNEYRDELLDDIHKKMTWFKPKPYQ